MWTQVRSGMRLLSSGTLCAGWVLAIGCFRQVGNGSMIPNDGSVWYQDSIQPVAGGRVCVWVFAWSLVSVPVLVSYHGITKYHKFRDLKQHKKYYLSVSMGQFRNELPGFSAQGFIWSKSRCHPELSSHLRLLAILNSHGCWQNSFPWVVGLRLSATRGHASPQAVYNIAACILLPGQEESISDDHSLLKASPN